MSVKFTVQVELDLELNRLTVVPTETMREWTERNNFVMKEFAVATLRPGWVILCKDYDTSIVQE